MGVPAAVTADMRLQILSRVARLGQENRHEEAGDLCLGLLRRNPGDAEGLALLGLTRLERDGTDAALGPLFRAAAVEPGSALILGRVGVALTRGGRTVEGTRLFARAARLSPFDPTTQINFVRALLRDGDQRQARDVLEQAVRHRPLDGPLLHELAGLLVKAGAWEAAEARYLGAAAVEPGRSEAWVGLGALYTATGRPVAAAAAYHHAIRRQPGDAALHGHRWAALRAARDLRGAHAAARRAAALDPGNAGRWRVLAEASQDLARFTEAIAFYRRALRQEPDCAATANNICGSLNDLGHHAEAAAFARRALALLPDLPEAWGSLANAHDNTDDPRGGVACNRRALNVRPDFQSSLWNMSLALLRLGDFPAGWAAYEARLDPRVKPDAFRLPRWNGQRYDGRTLLLCGEQGHGDVLQFLRYVPEAARRGGRVVLELHPGLVRLARTVMPGVTVYPLGEVTERCHLQAYLLSLPHLFGTALDTVPATVPYLHPDPVAALSWARRLADEPRLKVRLVWAGEPRMSDPRSHQIDRRRSLPAAAFAALADVAGVAFYSLQKGHGAAQRLPAALAATDWMDGMQDFADTAALVAGLDLVITVDTSVAHLAGALARPVWVLSRHDACWRWLGRRGDTPWYPTMRLFHQQAHGAWDGVIARVRTELAAAAGGDRRRLLPPAAAV